MKKKMLAGLLILGMILTMIPGMAEENDVINPEQVETHSALTVIHNIAKEYAKEEFQDTTGNLFWILADMAVYEELFPESEYLLSEEKKAESVKEVVTFLETATKPGDLAKGILALSSLGYDGKNIYTSSLEQIDAVEKLTVLVDEEDGEVSNIYTLPYVILALMQGEDYATDEQMEWLIKKALEGKEFWQDTEFGTDGITPMLLALAPFATSNPEVSAALEEGVELVKAEQRDDGMIDGFEGYEPASTGLAICGISALGVSADTVICGENSLIDGLCSAVNEEQNGFANEFATEQGFRGLLAWRLLEEGIGKRMYDFSDNPKKEVNLSDVKNCPVQFEVSPGTATVVIDGLPESQEMNFDLPEGTYSYTVSADGYLWETGTFTVSALEQSQHVLKKIPVTLLKLQGTVGGIPSYPGGGGSFGGSASGNVGTTVKEEKEDTELQNPKDEVPKEEESKEEVTKEEDGAKERENISYPDISRDSWYYEAVQFVVNEGLFQGTQEGFEPDLPMSRGMMVTVLYRFASPKEEGKDVAFLDVPQDAWYSAGVRWATTAGIVSGVSNDAFAPDEAITREQLAVILYRYAMEQGYPVEEGSLEAFSDGDAVSDYAKAGMMYAVEKGILQGNDKGELEPQGRATRAQVAVIMMRFANLGRE